MRRVPFLRAEADAYLAERRVAPCFICAIVAGEPLRARHRVLFEDERHLVFLSALPTQYGQTLVCPKRHVERFERDLSLEEYLALQAVAYRVAGALARVVRPARQYVASFGSNEGNRHVHMHLVPLPEGVPPREQQMAAMQPEAAGLLELEPEEWERLAADLRSAIA